MTSGFESAAGPNYISAHSADVIISDVRPIKLKLEALRSLNVLLDEFLYKILDVSGSLSTDKIKTSLLKVLPTALGKEAVLEAELELKAYWERNPPASPLSNGSDATEGFDLRWSFELLRLKCEAYSTMNDTDEDAMTEKALSDRMANVSNSSPPDPDLVAPAALYFTAILEYVCEHILSNVSRVAARDSSRTTATVQDLFVALCEDDNVYTMFKYMKVFEQIESLSASQKPRRSKSLSRSTDRNSPARVSSSAVEAVSPTAGSLSPVRARMSSDSMTSSATVVRGSSSSQHRTSMEKARVKMFSRSSNDNGEKMDSFTELTRIQSESAKSGNSLDVMSQEDAALVHEFDELMRSGATMKVSLTPDRLKTMEVYKQEKKRTMIFSDGTNGATSPEPKRGHTARKPSLRNVDSIVEDEEDATPASVPPSAYHQTVVPRTRQSSLSQSPGVPNSLLSHSRLRAVSVSNLTGKKPSPAPKTAASPPLELPPQRMNSNRSKFTPGMPPRTKRVARNRESLDLDEVMGGGSEDDEVEVSAPPPVKKGAATPAKPHISKGARDLIDFLDEGPPEELRLPSVNPSMVSFESSKSKSSGRFSRVMSRLNLGGSTERLNGRSSTLEKAPTTPKARKTTFSSAKSPVQMMKSPVPPLMLQHSSLSQKRSMPNVVIGTPPPRLPPPPPPISPTTSSAEDMTSSPPLSNPRRASMVRKAVPVWHGDGSVPPLPPVPTDQGDIKAPSGDAAPSKPLNGVNGRAKDVFDDGPATEMEAIRNPDPKTLDTKPPPNTEPPAKPVNARFPKSHARLASKTPSDESHGSDAVAKSAKPAVVNGNANEQKIDEAGPHDLVLSPDDVRDLRRLLSAATTADECRLLVDMIFAQNKNPRAPVEASVVTEQPRTHDEAIERMKSANDELERSLIALLLGDDAIDKAVADVPAPSLPAPLAV